MIGWLGASRRRIEALERRALANRAAAAAAARGARETGRRALSSVDALTVSFVAGLAWGKCASLPRSGHSTRPLWRTFVRSAIPLAAAWLARRSPGREACVEHPPADA